MASWEYLQNILGPQGTPGTPGAPGADGSPGTPGADGFSPVASVEQTDDGATITITDKTHTSVANIKNGKDGKKGYSPIVTVEQTDNGATITAINEGAIIYTADVKNGKDGTPGTNGKNGSTFTPTVSESNGQYTMSWSNDGDLSNPASVSWHNGADGAPGEQGNPGPGVAAGGTTGQKLVKKTNVDYDTEWVDDTSGGLPAGGTTGAVLTIGSDGNPTWSSAMGYTPNPVGGSGPNAKTVSYSIPANSNGKSYTARLEGNGYGLLIIRVTNVYEGNMGGAYQFYKYYDEGGVVKTLNYSSGFGTQYRPDTPSISIVDNQITVTINVDSYEFEGTFEVSYYYTDNTNHELIQYKPQYKEGVFDFDHRTLEYTIPYGLIVNESFNFYPMFKPGVNNAYSTNESALVKLADGSSTLILEGSYPQAMQNQAYSSSSPIKGPSVNIDTETHKLTISVASDISDKDMFNTTVPVKIYPI